MIRLLIRVESLRSNQSFQIQRRSFSFLSHFFERRCHVKNTEITSKMTEAMGNYTITKNAPPVSMETFRINRERLYEKMKSVEPQGFILLKGGEAVNVYNTDVEYTFKQEPFFHWAFGVRHPSYWGAICLKTNTSYLFMPRLPESYAIWMGELLTPEDVKTLYSVNQVYYEDEISTVLTKCNPKKIFLLSGTNTDSDIKMDAPQFENSKKYPTDLTVLYPTMSELRVLKNEHEIELLRQASMVSSEAHKYVMRNLPSMVGHFEYQAESIFLHYCYYTGGCRTTAYTCICGSGPNAAVLHYGHAGAPNDKIINDGEMCLFDMGASYYGYASDITCSFPVNGKFTEEQKVIYNAVLNARNKAVEESRPGVQWEKVHLHALRAMFTEMKAHNLLVGDVEEMLDAELGSIFMPHGLGHLMGIDVHDVGGYLDDTPPRPTRASLKNLRMNRFLLKNMVLTIEPGCYFIDVLLEKAKNDEKMAKFINFNVVNKFKRFGGVRIEDDVLITDYGCELLSKVPRTVEEIEAWMNQEEEVKLHFPLPNQRGKKHATPILSPEVIKGQ
ncbi:xaa-Pro dipeptidase [Cimex lectularius]|uniref:Xaa-Pro dipeptidase n=1 Tax=Cimex lectularius TaxID=79782 RepID=A0A8I6RKI7_CIMLE|nr:xaa-Pro dipeptidase [Cimex lectularius]